MVRGTSRCTGTLEVKVNVWRPVFSNGYKLILKEAAVICEHLDCGPAVSVEERMESTVTSVWAISSDCLQSGSVLRECVFPWYSFTVIALTCLGKPIIDIL